MTYKDYVNLGTQKLGKEHKSTIQKFLKIKQVADELNINHLATDKYVRFLDEIKRMVHLPSKITKTKEGKNYFKEIDKQGRVDELKSSYISHQTEKAEFSKRITAYMMDFLATPIAKEEDLWQ